MRLRNAVSLVLAAGLGAAAVVRAPAVMASICPSCYGLETVAPGLHVDAAMTLPERAALQSALGEAKRRVSVFFGVFEHDPTLLVCVTAECDAMLGAEHTAARTFGTFLIHLTRVGRDATVIAHELAHVEINDRIGTWRLVTGDFPVWFNEGLAVVVSRDRGAMIVPGIGAPRCRVEPAGPLPVKSRDWRRESAAGGARLYARAACRVLRWIDAQGGRRRALERLDAAGWDASAVSEP